MTENHQITGVFVSVFVKLIDKLLMFVVYENGFVRWFVTCKLLFSIQRSSKQSVSLMFDAVVFAVVCM